MLKFLEGLRRIFCRHDFRYSKSRPGTLVCQLCGYRRRD